MKRVVVTGIGSVSPLGNTVQESWAAARAGQSGISAVTRFDVSRLKWKMAGELKGFHAGKYLHPKEMLRLDLFIQYAVAAAAMAAEDADLIAPGSTGEPKSRDGISGYLSSAGVVIGSSRGGIATLEKGLQSCGGGKVEGRINRRLSAYLMPSTTIGMAPAYVAKKLGAKGYCLGISNACASGANAIGEAYRIIKAGYQYPVFCGGSEAPISGVCMEGYGTAGALSQFADPAASRPFDRRRNGFVLAEGAAILVLEEYKAALNRGACIYGEILGYGNTVDSFHQTVPSSEGEARAIRGALLDAGLQPEEIGLISAHGTSTPVGDRQETEAIKLAFGGKAHRIPVTAVKSMTGHILAGSGALEAAFLLLSMKEEIILPVRNLEFPDPACDLDYVTEMRQVSTEVGLCESFGFGGLNAVLIFRRISS